MRGSLPAHPTSAPHMRWAVQPRLGDSVSARSPQGPRPCLGFANSPPQDVPWATLAGLGVIEAAAFRMSLEVQLRTWAITD